MSSTLVKTQKRTLLSLVLFEHDLEEKNAITLLIVITLIALILRSLFFNVNPPALHQDQPLMPITHIV